MSLFLVTGGAGFIGSNIVEEHLKRSHTVATLPADSATPPPLSEPTYPYGPEECVPRFEGPGVPADD